MPNIKETRGSTRMFFFDPSLQIPEKRRGLLKLGELRSTVTVLIVFKHDWRGVEQHLSEFTPYDRVELIEPFDAPRASVVPGWTSKITQRVHVTEDRKGYRDEGGFFYHNEGGNADMWCQVFVSELSEYVVAVGYMGKKKTLEDVQAFTRHLLTAIEIR